MVSESSSRRRRVRGFWLSGFILAGSAGACATDLSRDLDGFACDDTGQCAPGYICNTKTNSCVRLGASGGSSGMSGSTGGTTSNVTGGRSSSGGGTGTMSSGGRSSGGKPSTGSEAGTGSISEGGAQAGGKP
ncbi:MAG TPA: hypothetical protein VFQ61_28300, partial [Polyangiaceae bacterium]|nr:hypothetical protein [Polyangiaceae bacterium]